MDFEKAGDGRNPGAPGRWDTGYPWGSCKTAAWRAWPRSKQRTGISASRGGMQWEKSHDEAHPHRVPLAKRLSVGSQSLPKENAKARARAQAGKRNRILYTLKDSSYKRFTDFRRKIVTSRWRETIGVLFIKRSKSPSLVMTCRDNMCLQTRATEKSKHHFSVPFLLKHNMKTIRRKQQTNPK